MYLLVYDELITYNGGLCKPGTLQQMGNFTTLIMSWLLGLTKAKYFFG